MGQQSDSTGPNDENMTVLRAWATRINLDSNQPNKPIRVNGAFLYELGQHLLTEKRWSMNAQSKAAGIGTVAKNLRHRPGDAPKQTHAKAWQVARLCDYYARWLGEIDNEHYDHAEESRRLLGLVNQGFIIAAAPTGGSRTHPATAGPLTGTPPPPLATDPAQDLCGFCAEAKQVEPIIEDEIETLSTDNTRTSGEFRTQDDRTLSADVAVLCLNGDRQRELLGTALRRGLRVSVGCRCRAHVGRFHDVDKRSREDYNKVVREFESNHTRKLELTAAEIRQAISDTPDAASAPDQIRASLFRYKLMPTARYVIVRDRLVVLTTYVELPREPREYRLLGQQNLTAFIRKGHQNFDGIQDRLLTYHLHLFDLAARIDAVEDFTGDDRRLSGAGDSVLESKPQRAGTPSGLQETDPREPKPPLTVESQHDRDKPLGPEGLRSDSTPDGDET